MKVYTSEANVAHRGVKFEGRVEKDKGFYLAFLLSVGVAIIIAIYALSSADYNFIESLDQCERQRLLQFEQFRLAGSDDNQVVRALQQEEKFIPQLRGSKDIPPPIKGLAVRFLNSQSTQSLESFLVRALSVIIPCFFLSIFVGWGWISVLQKHAKKFVFASVVFIPAILIILGVILYPNEDTRVLGVVWLIMGVLSGAIFFCLRRKLNLAASIISESCAALRDNTQLVYLSLKIAVVLIFVELFFGGSYFLLMLNGEPKKSVGTCVWVINDSSLYTMVILSFILTWVTMVFNFMRSYVISGTIGVWYFHRDQEFIFQILLLLFIYLFCFYFKVLSLSRNTKHNQYTMIFISALHFVLSMKPTLDEINSSDRTLVPAGTNPINMALKWAKLSSGSICYSALVVTIAEKIRRSIENNNNSGIFGIILVCIVNCIKGIIEMISRFAIVWCSITGDSFCDSARSATQILKRNLLSTLIVDSMTNFVLGFSAFILASIIGLIGMGLSTFLVENKNNTLEYSIVVGFIVIILSALVLFFYAGIIISISDAVFLFYAIDKDNKVSAPGHAKGFTDVFSAIHIQPSN